MSIFETPYGYFKCSTKEEVLQYLLQEHPDIKNKDISIIVKSPYGVEIFNITAINNFKSEIKRVTDNAQMHLHNAPTRRFSIGDAVIYGNINGVIVKDILMDGLVYVLADNSTQIATLWMKVFAVDSQSNNSNLRDDEALQLHYGNSPLHSLIHRNYVFGVNMDPSYQRGLEWSLTDKELLIDSVFKNLDIGKFVYVYDEYENTLPYSILDGKQRLSAILEFVEDRFRYKGLLFSELSRRDRNFFESKSVVFADIDIRDLAGGEETIVKYFLRLNQGGVAVDKQHLENLRTKYNIKD